MKESKYSHLKKTETDAFLIGAGIMSTTLATLLVELFPDWKIQISERRNSCAQESSSSLNNAGTGHSGYCELNYTPEDANGNIDISKAINVHKAFSKSEEFWQHLIASGKIKPDIYTISKHISFVTGKKDVDYLRRRWETMSKSDEFEDLEYYSTNEDLLKQIPLMMEGRNNNDPCAITVHDGYDIDYGKITKYFIENLHQHHVDVNTNHEVIDLYKLGNKWNVIQKNVVTNELSKIETKFVFIGAGGAAITLLEKSEIPEAKGYAGFPVSGEWLICDNQQVVAKHFSKVYGRPSVGSPPMSTPHLDLRTINGKQCLLFGPYAGMSTKFLKHGSWTDFFKSIRLNNIGVLLDAGARNLGLTKYLMKELFKSKAGRFKVLKEYYPNANPKDWKTSVAGQRVQVIKRVNGKGVIEFGTELVTAKDGSLACLLGASPGAATSVKVMLDLIETCFTLDATTKEKLAAMIPTYGKKINAK
jgi:malate dehydrogenase (quinone)